MGASNLRVSLKELAMVPKGVIIGAVLISTMLPILNIFFLKAGAVDNAKYFKAAADIARLSSVEFLKSGNIPSACDAVQAPVNQGLFTFYVIQLRGNEICSGPSELRSEINAKYKSFGQAFDAGDFDFQSSKVENYVVTTGYLNGSWSNFLPTLKSKIPRMLVAWFAGMIVILILVQILSRPWKALIASYKGRLESQSIFNKIGESKEYHQIVGASQALKNETQQLKTAMHFISSDFTHELLTRMQLDHKTFPYFFSGSFLRFDLNGYTKLYFENDKLKISQIISAIAIGVDELVNRHGGSHYGFGGDEFIELFVGDDSELRALSCARDIFYMVEQLDFPNDLKLRVKFKAAISYDNQILFSRLPQCYSLTSDSLILTNRYFSVIDDKNTNSLIIGRNNNEHLFSLARFGEVEVHRFKNISTESSIQRLTNFISLDDITTMAPNFLKFFVSDLDIHRMLQIVGSNGTPKLTNSILSHLKNIPVTVCNPNILEAWMNAALNLDQSWNENKVHLSSLINCGKNLIPKAIWRDAQTALLLNLRGLADARVKADVIELLAHKASVSEYEKALEELVEENLSIRAKGNILVKQADLSLDDTIISDLKAMLSSSSPNEVAAGIYCVSRIVLNYRKKDPVMLSQFLEFNEFILEVLRFSKHENVMIRSRAIIELENLKEETAHA